MCTTSFQVGKSTDSHRHLDALILASVRQQCQGESLSVSGMHVKDDV